MELPPLRSHWGRGAVECSTLERLPRDRTWCRHESGRRHNSSTLIPPRQDCTAGRGSPQSTDAVADCNWWSESERFLLFQGLSLLSPGRAAFTKVPKEFSRV